MNQGNLYAEVSQLLATSFALNDAGSYSELKEMFVDDIVFHTPLGDFVGADMVVDLLTARRTQRASTAHLVANVLVEDHDDGAVEAKYLVTVFRQETDGEPGRAQGIVRWTDVLRRDGGLLRFVDRTVEPLMELVIEDRSNDANDPA